MQKDFIMLVISIFDDYNFTSKSFKKIITKMLKYIFCHHKPDIILNG